MASAISTAAAAEKEKEADKLMKKGQKEVSPSLLDFRLKPDWEQAAPKFEEAAKLYKQIKNLPKALEAYEQSALAQERLGSLWHAGRHYEACAEMCRQYEDKVTRAVTYYQRAADCYSTAGKAAAGGEVLLKGARAVQEVDPEAAVKMLMEALELYEVDSKEAMGMDAYRETVSVLIKCKRYGEAAEQLMRFALACSQVGSTNSQCKAYLGAVVVHLYNQDGTSAWGAFQDAMNVEVFTNSDEAFLADALFTAYSSGTADAVKKVVNDKQGFRHLDNQVARLALKLPTGKFEVVSKDVAVAMGQQVEADEGEEEEEDVM